MKKKSGKKKYASGLMLVALLVCAGWAEAATATFGVDPVADYAATRIYRATGPCANPGAFALINTFAKPATSGVLANPTADGLYCHRATAIDTANNESVFSNTAEFDYNVVPPKAPQPFSVVP